MFFVECSDVPCSMTMDLAFSPSDMVSLRSESETDPPMAVELSFFSVLPDRAWHLVYSFAHTVDSDKLGNFIA